MTERAVTVRLKAEVADFKRAMGEATKAVDKLPESTKKAETSLGRMVQSAEHNRQAWDLAGGALLGVGTAAVVGLGMASKAAIDWESQWTGVLKTVNGTPAELAAVEDGLRTLAKTLPSTHQEIAAVAEAAGQLGVKTKDVVSFTKTMIDLGETTNLTADEAATSIAQLMNVMGTAPKDVGRLGASLVALGNNGASTERDIIQMAQRIAGAGKIVGLTEGEVMGLANALSSVGIEVEAGGSAISTVMTDMAKAVEQGGTDLESFASVAGMSGADFSTAFKDAPADAIATFIEGLGTINAAGGDVFTTLEGLGQSDVRVSRALLTMAGSGDLLRDSLALGNSAWADNIALAAEAEKRYDTTAAKLDIAKNGISDAAITIGESFLPMLADASEKVADLAGWIGQLPQPLLQAGAGLTAVGGFAALAGGAFLLTFPRIMDTVKAFKDLREINPGVASGLGKVGKAAGAVGIALMVATAAAAVFGEKGDPKDVSEYTKALLELGGSGKDIKMTGFEVRGLDDAFRRMTDKSAMESVDDWSGKITGIIGQRSEVAILGDEFDKLGQGLITLYDSSPELAAEKFQQILAETGGTSKELLELMPSYATKLQDVDNAQVIAGESATGLSDGLEPVTPAVQAATDALEAWLTMVSDSDASFVDLGSSWDAVIQKNTDVATSTADSTEDASDSWEDYYDGVTVSSADYIAELQTQVDAQSAWEENMLAISDRVKAGMTGDMADAANGMIDELLALGPEGAAQVALLRTMSDAEFAQVVTLWSQKGTTAVAEFTNKVESYRQPVISVTADTSAATAAVNSLLYGIGLKQAHIGVSSPAALKAAGLSDGSWADGGYTGDGGKHEPAGLVHKGEYVITAAKTREIGVANLNAVYGGYANGGLVGGGSSSASASPGGMTNNFDIREASDPVGTAHAVIRRLNQAGAV